LKQGWKKNEKLVRQPGGIVPTQFGHFPSPGAVTAIKEKVRIDHSKNLTSHSVVDPDPVVFGTSFAMSGPDPE
jgi:hypothetical protein